MPETENAKHSPDLLLIFTRNPVLGKVKTRLAEKTGEKAALKIYKFLLTHTVTITKDLNIDKEVHYSEKIQKQDIWEDSIYKKRKQLGKNLGSRMEYAFREGFHAGYKKIIVIGSDLLDLEQKDLENAFLALENHDFVIGPAKDGGYYLLGMKFLPPSIFTNINWGASQVFEQTINTLIEERVAVLETRNDIDTIQDVKEFPILDQFLNE